MQTQKTVPSGLERWRFTAVFIVIGVVFLAYVIRLFSLQIINGAEYSAYAEENRVKEISTQTQRGNIYDRNGIVLAKNTAAYNVVITPAYLPVDTGTTEEIYRELSTLIGIPVTNGQLTEK